MVAPRKYDREKLVPLILERLKEGEPLAVILRDMGIHYEAVKRWRRDDPDIAEQFFEARDVGYDVIAHRIRSVARGDHRTGKDSLTLVQRDRLIVETDLKLLSKWDPRRYGDRTTVDFNGHLAVEQEVTPDRARVVLQEALLSLDAPEGDK